MRSLALRRDFDITSSCRRVWRCSFRGYKEGVQKVAAHFPQSLGMGNGLTGNERSPIDGRMLPLLVGWLMTNAAEQYNHVLASPRLGLGEQRTCTGVPAENIIRPPHLGWIPEELLLTSLELNGAGGEVTGIHASRKMTERTGPRWLASILIERFERGELPAGILCYFSTDWLVVTCHPPQYNHQEDRPAPDRFFLPLTCHQQKHAPAAHIMCVAYLSVPTARCQVCKAVINVSILCCPELSSNVSIILLAKGYKSIPLCNSFATTHWMQQAVIKLPSYDFAQLVTSTAAC
uniref:Uncharacterized protein n=1 Tax=Setaria digitata TaxID=48799 RepID=A0A915PTU2_9BILA